MRRISPDRLISAPAWCGNLHGIHLQIATVDLVKAQLHGYYKLPKPKATELSVGSPDKLALADIPSSGSPGERRYGRGGDKGENVRHL